MRKIGFINLVLPAGEDAGPPPPAWSGDWDHTMKTLADRCATAQGTGGESVVADYKVEVSPPIRCVYPASSRRTGADP
jgi:hypothetical protein